MSRIGNKVIQVPASVTVTVSPENYVVVKGPKAQLEYQFNQRLGIKLEGDTITVTRPNDEIFSRKIHGTTRALIANMVTGVSEGFKKQLEIRGVGYRAAVQDNIVNLSMGFSHPVNLEIPAGITVTIPKNTDVIIEGADKQAPTLLLRTRHFLLHDVEVVFVIFSVALSAILPIDTRKLLRNKSLFGIVNFITSLYTSK